MCMLYRSKLQIRSIIILQRFADSLDPGPLSAFQCCTSRACVEKIGESGDEASLQVHVG